MKRKLAFLGAILLAAFIFTYEGNTYQTHALDEEDQAWIEEARGALQNIVEDREVMALVYLCDDLTIRAEAAEDSTKVVTVPSGQMVEIRDVTMDEDSGTSHIFQFLFQFCDTMLDLTPVQFQLFLTGALITHAATGTALSTQCIIHSYQSRQHILQSGCLHL